MSIDPNDVHVIDNKGYTVYKVGNISGAIDMATKAISIEKDYANAWYNRACYYASENKTNESISDLNQAVMLDEKYGYDALEDKDFDKIRDHPKFIELLKEFKYWHKETDSKLFFDSICYFTEHLEHLEHLEHQYIVHSIFF